MNDISQGSANKGVEYSQIPVVKNPLPVSAQVDLNSFAGQQGQFVVNNDGGEIQKHLIKLIQRLLELLQSKPKPPKFKSIEVTKEQDEGIRKHFSLTDEMSYRVKDKNGDGRLSAGDVLVVFDDKSGEKIFRKKLSAEDVKSINEAKGNPLEEAKEQLTKNREKWQSQGIEDYTFTLERSCFCPEEVTKPVEITVRNGEVVAAKFADSGENLPLDHFNVMTIDSLFDVIEREINEKSASVNVQYDEATGRPVSIFVDQFKGAVDDEYGLTVSDFSTNPDITTLALGEEDGGMEATTLMLGEEDGGLEPSTKALGEEDGGWDLPPVDITTLALGEEDGGFIPPIIIEDHIEPHADKQDKGDR